MLVELTYKPRKGLKDVHDLDLDNVDHDVDLDLDLPDAYLAQSRLYFAYCCLHSACLQGFPVVMMIIDHDEDADYDDDDDGDDHDNDNDGLDDHES